uniref:dual specificity tyrosine-phosphorylation-regulated kinase 2-like n=1 Tax=Myxine glutinosa TaxID=7769 RepID=UPI00358E157B
MLPVWRPHGQGVRQRALPPLHTRQMAVGKSHNGKPQPGGAVNWTGASGSTVHGKRVALAPRTNVIRAPAAAANGGTRGPGGPVRTSTSQKTTFPGASSELATSKFPSLPMAPNEAMGHHMASLSAFEHHEIFSYPDIYFLGPGSEKRRCAGAGVKAGKPGAFDDANGCYIVVAHDHVAYRYEILKVIGKGSFGQVLKVFDHKEHRQVALKMVRNQKSFQSQAAVEIKILELLRKQDADGTLNIVHLLESFTFRGHVCMTFELLSINLFELVKKHDYRGFDLLLVRKFAHAILKCLEALRRSRIIHCDLKPENVLLKQHGHSGIKVIDFGSSCFEERRMYSYIQSRFYRAPEVILGAPYGPPIDIWSLGCILAELVTGLPIFPGEDEADQLACIMELLGKPPSNVLAGARHARKFITSAGHPHYCVLVAQPDGSTLLAAGRSRRGKVRGPPASRSWMSALKGCNDLAFLDFLRHCLLWDPAQRLTPTQALRHNWVRRRKAAIAQQPDKGPTGKVTGPTGRIKVGHVMPGETSKQAQVLRTVLPKIVS